MDKEWLERRLYKRVGTIYGVQEKTEDVDAIAAQHKQELARARSEKTELLPCGHPASVVEDDLSVPSHRVVGLKPQSVFAECRSFMMSLPAKTRPGASCAFIAPPSKR